MKTVWMLLACWLATFTSVANPYHVFIEPETNLVFHFYMDTLDLMIRADTDLVPVRARRMTGLGPNRTVEYMNGIVIQRTIFDNSTYRLDITWTDDRHTEMVMLNEELEVVERIQRFNNYQPALFLSSSPRPIPHLRYFWD